MDMSRSLHRCLTLAGMAVVPKPLLRGLGCELSVLVLLEVGASGQSGVLRVLGQVLEFSIPDQPPCPSCVSL